MLLKWNLNSVIMQKQWPAAAAGAGADAAGAAMLVLGETIDDAEDDWMGLFRHIWLVPDADVAAGALGSNYRILTMMVYFM